MRRETYFVLVLVDHGEIEVAVACADSVFNLFDGEYENEIAYSPFERRTAFSTSLGFDNHVPKPTWGM